MVHLWTPWNGASLALYLNYRVDYRVFRIQYFDFKIFWTASKFNEKEKANKSKIVIRVMLVLLLAEGPFSLRFQGRGKIIGGKRNLVYPMRGCYSFPLNVV